MSAHELQMKSFLSNNNINYIYQQRKLNPIYRPDFEIITIHPDIIIILEVDQNQHQNYSLVNEYYRMKSIYFSTKKRFILFIRFNPDKFYSSKFSRTNEINL